MRGKVPNAGGIRPYERITPAYAGKSSTQVFYTVRVGDHPRVCGEKNADATFIGSNGWITPAYAGKSRSAICFAVAPSGSPPRMRGKGL